jgi:ubiquinol-cytochrome c reductase cytochrome c subunit
MQAGVRGLALISLLAAALAAPAPAAPPAVTRGTHLYGQYCLKCHGPNGAGTPGLAPSLRGVGALAPDFYLRTGYMPLAHVGKQPKRTRVLLSEPEIRALVAYVASLGKGPPIPTPAPSRGTLSEGLHLFTLHCAGCHQIAAAGGYVTGALPPPLDRATDTQIAEAVRVGPYVMPRFSERAISNAELDSIVAYLNYVKHPDDPGGWSLGRVGPVPEGLVTWLIAAAACVGFCVLIGERLRRA